MATSISLTDFVRENYDIFSKGDSVDPQNLESVEDFFLMERHSSIGEALIHSQLINTFTDYTDIVMLEGCPWMGPDSLENSKGVLKTLLKTKATISGWENNDFVSQLKTCPYPSQATRAKLDSNVSLSLSECEDYKLQASAFTDFALNTFANRTTAMIQSILKASQSFHHRFIVAGRAHFDKNVVNSEISGSLFTPEERTKIREGLESFNQFFLSRKAVILSPKEEKIKIMDFWLTCFLTSS